MTEQTRPDPLAYGPTGHPCGCGKDAHSNLVPCQPDPVHLDEIEARAAGLYEYATGLDAAWQAEADQLAGTDVPALLTKVRRLQDRVAELEGLTPHTPRICECGHSHHAHTVPAPHSCFAHGQTCPCPAYRQMSHEDAVAHQTRKAAEYAASAAGESGSTR